MAADIRPSDIDFAVCGLNSQCGSQNEHEVFNITLILGGNLMIALKDHGLTIAL
jgi:hypothetical protein